MTRYTLSACLRDAHKHGAAWHRTQIAQKLVSRGMTGDGRLRKMSVAAVNQVGDRSVRFTISTGSLDRDADTVSQAGWILDNYRRNPVVLFGHNSRELPIAKTTNIGLEGGALKATAQFVPADMPVAGPLADGIYRMLCSGFLSAVSVGFRPLEFDLIERGEAGLGFNFVKQELMEFSVCTIPANPEALIEPGQFFTQTSSDGKSARQREAKADLDWVEMALLLGLPLERPKTQAARIAAIEIVRAGR